MHHAISDARANRYAFRESIASNKEFRRDCALRSSNGTIMNKTIPLDPDLPIKFDSTANHKRSKAQLDAWWDQPYAVTREDGRIEVRCLNGCDWNSSTLLDIVDDYEAACLAAVEKQTVLASRRKRRSIVAKRDGIYLLIIEQRPDQGVRQLIGPFKRYDELGEWIIANPRDL